MCSGTCINHKYHSHIFNANEKMQTLINQKTLRLVGTGRFLVGDKLR